MERACKTGGVMTAVAVSNKCPSVIRYNCDQEVKKLVPQKRPNIEGYNELVEKAVAATTALDMEGLQRVIERAKCAPMKVQD